MFRQRAYDAGRRAFALRAPLPLTIMLCMPLTALILPVQAAPRKMADCEKFKDADAYNKCLASFGPKRGRSATGKGYRRPKGAGKRHRRSRAGTYRGIRIYRSKGRVRTIIPVPRP